MFVWQFVIHLYMQLMGTIQCCFIHVFRTARDVVVVISA